MTQDDAEAFLRQYRALLKEWTMIIGGFKEGDASILERKLDADQHILTQIAIAFPSKGYSVDLLANARIRTWAGYQDERIPRPGGAAAKNE